MICFQISIFEPLKTAMIWARGSSGQLWFAFKLVSLNHWKQRVIVKEVHECVVICFQISIFEPLKTASFLSANPNVRLWFAFKLVSLNHWKQPWRYGRKSGYVVICFQISIFEPLKTAYNPEGAVTPTLWFAFKLVSLNHWKQPLRTYQTCGAGCDLLSN